MKVWRKKQWIDERRIPFGWFSKPNKRIIIKLTDSILGYSLIRKDLTRIDELILEGGATFETAFRNLKFYNIEKVTYTSDDENMDTIRYWAGFYSCQHLILDVKSVNFSTIGYHFPNLVTLEFKNIPLEVVYLKYSEMLSNLLYVKGLDKRRYDLLNLTLNHRLINPRAQTRVLYLLALIKKTRLRPKDVYILLAKYLAEIPRHFAIREPSALRWHMLLLLPPLLVLFIMIALLVYYQK